MKILLLTPAPEGSRAGNRATAERWSQLLTVAGHEVTIGTGYELPAARDCNLLIALHAWRSHEAVSRFRQEFPYKPLIVVLTGTDIYRFQHTEPATTLATMAMADTLIGLHRLVGEDIPGRFHDRLHTVLQSAERPPAGQDPDPDHFDVCVVGHLREEKDSLRAARAARLVPPDSALRIVQAGKAHNAGWADAARAESRENPRFVWLEEIDRSGVQGLMARSRLMVISSIMEGGANVVSEACRAGLPVIASDIAGNRGLLGDDYPGYYPVADERVLADLLLKAEREPAYLEELSARVSRRAGDFTPEAEQAALLAAIRATVSVSP